MLPKLCCNATCIDPAYRKKGEKKKRKQIEMEKNVSSKVKVDSLFAQFGMIHLRLSNNFQFINSMYIRKLRAVASTFDQNS